jgi:superfamily II DNA/RNA helicase
MHNQIPKVTADGKRLQMIVCSATLHDFDVKKLAVSLKIDPEETTYKFDFLNQ